MIHTECNYRSLMYKITSVSKHVTVTYDESRKIYSEDRYNENNLEIRNHSLKKDLKHAYILI